MAFVSSFQRLVSGLNPWAPLFAFVALFQFLRGANFDTVYFSLVVVILLLDSKKIFPYEFPNRPKLNLWLVIAVSIFVAALLYLAPRRSALEVAIMVAVFFVGLTLIWHKDAGPKKLLTIQLNRAKWLWILVGVLVSLWELFAYILSDIADDSSAYPTVSVLMGPFMASEWGRLVFLTLWLAAGISLLRIERKK